MILRNHDEQTCARHMTSRVVKGVFLVFFQFFVGGIIFSTPYRGSWLHQRGYFPKKISQGNILTTPPCTPLMERDHWTATVSEEYL